MGLTHALGTLNPPVPELFCFYIPNLIALFCFAPLYKHLFICNPYIHSDEGLQSEMSVFFKNKFFSIHYGVKFNYL